MTHPLFIYLDPVQHTTPFVVFVVTALVPVVCTATLILLWSRLHSRGASSRSLAGLVPSSFAGAQSSLMAKKQRVLLPLGATFMYATAALTTINALSTPQPQQGALLLGLVLCLAAAAMSTGWFRVTFPH
ncbi:MAG: hypothetical protein Q4G45_11030 [Actinomycetia bacterium]|nr:hypothetical protein [Actinomycetes bacterium]